MTTSTNRLISIDDIAMKDYRWTCMRRGMWAVITPLAPNSPSTINITFCCDLRIEAMKLRLNGQ